MIWRQFITKRKKQHIYGQNSAITKNNRTALEDHVVNEGHRFDFDNMKILDMNSNYGKLKILEMLHINANNTVNKRSDVANTIHQYSGLLHHLSVFVKLPIFGKPITDPKLPLPIGNYRR